MADILSISDVLTFVGKASDATDAERAQIQMLLPLAEDAVRNYLGYTVTQQSHTLFLPEADNFSAGQEKLDVINSKIVIDVVTASDILFVPERPLRSVSSINVDRAARHGQGASDFSGDALTEGTDYELFYQSSGLNWTGQIRRINATWPQRAGTVKITFTAGLTAAEIDDGSVRGPNGVSVRNIKYAAMLAVVNAWQESLSHQPGATGAMGAVKSERLADYSVTYAGEAAAQSAMMFDLPEKSKQLLMPFRRLPFS